MAIKIYRISKSQYLKGIQCSKALWLYRHRPDLAPEISESQQFLFDIGNEIGKLAQQYFRSGIEIEAEYYEVDKSIKSTKKAIKQGDKILFEATACSKDGAYSRIDILKKVRGSDFRDLIEVKASTSAKDYHIDDIALQRYAFLNAGYRIRKSILMYVNNEYVRSGELDLKKLFKQEDCTKLVDKKIGQVKRNVKKLIETINNKNEPPMEIGGQCSSPFDCDYKGYCWDHVPDYSVYNIFKGNKLNDLLSENILNIPDIPGDFNVTDRQLIEVNSFKRNRIYKDKKRIKEFLSSLTYPLYYLDYETINPAIPLFDNTSPYQLIPFQFSLHIQKIKGGKLKHVEFLYTEQGDPRPELIKSLLENCGEKGSVVVYNKGFESRVNNELGQAFPKFKNRLKQINERMVDVMIPFKSRFLYHPKMKGSASLKDVLPAFVPKMSYDDLAISDGGSASILYFSCIKNLVSEADKNKIYNNLKDYCCQDTLAEVKLIEVLNKNS